MLRFGIAKTPSDLQLEIAERHRAIRKSMGWSQTEMAERSGISLGSVKRFERTGKISIESLLQLAHTLNRLEDFDTIFKQMEDQSNIEKLFSDKTRKS